MNTSGDILSWVVLGAILLFIFAGCGFVIKRFLIDKKYYGGYQFIGRQIYSKFQNAERREAVDEVTYMEEEERLQNFVTGADNTDNKADPEGVNHNEGDGQGRQVK